MKNYPSNSAKSFNHKIYGAFAVMLMITAMIALGQSLAKDNTSKLSFLFPVEHPQVEENNHRNSSPNFHFNVVGIFTDLVLRR
ncbi:hypothetical protein [Persicobacter sp. CCB-QB2]|uniref:hypothetical protein n=1 Tax=Persicobacter sp. CCB-QB2 TaxID=1561025 RepID=UPI0006A98D8D|nr:hypothetical protein [Persicobacter sp. CCB-QB2]